MKKLVLYLSILLLTNFCTKDNVTSLVIFDASPKYVQETVADITWADNTKTCIIIEGSDVFYNIPSGSTIINMTYKCDTIIYYSSYFINIEYGQEVPIFCTFQNEKD